MTLDTSGDVSNGRPSIPNYEGVPLRFSPQLNQNFQNYALSNQQQHMYQQQFILASQAQQQQQFIPGFNWSNSIQANGMNTTNSVNAICVNSGNAVNEQTTQAKSWYCLLNETYTFEHLLNDIDSILRESKDDFCNGIKPFIILNNKKQKEKIFNFCNELFKRVAQVLNFSLKSKIIAPKEKAPSKMLEDIYTLCTFFKNKAISIEILELFNCSKSSKEENDEVANIVDSVLKDYTISLNHNLNGLFSNLSNELFSEIKNLKAANDNLTNTVCNLEKS